MLVVLALIDVVMISNLLIMVIVGGYETFVSRMNLCCSSPAWPALVAGAELLVRGASKLALSFGISPLVVGLTIVAFGTSAPEMAVSVGAVLDGKHRHRGRQRGRQQHLQRAVHPGPVGADHAAGGQRAADPPGGADHDRRVAAAAGAGLDGRIGLADGALLFALLVAYTVFLVVQSRRETQAARDEYEASKPAAARRLGLAAAGATAADRRRAWPAGAGLRVAGHVGRGLRQGAGRQRLVIGLTIVAAGTSMPEVATSVMAASRASATSRWATWWAATPSTSWAAWAWPAWWPAGRPADAAVGAELRPLGHAGRGAGLPAGVPDRARDRALGRRVFLPTTSPTWPT
jgi:hypothetical protein